MACCHDQRSAGKPDKGTGTYNCHLKEGKFSLRSFIFGWYLQADAFVSMRIKETGDDKVHKEAT